MSERSDSIVAALAVAPLAAIPAIVLFLLIAHITEIDPFFSAPMIPAYIIFGLPFAYLFTLIIGIPSHLLLVQMGLNGSVAHVVCGAVGGFVVGMFFFDATTARDQFLLGLMLAICGAAVSAAFERITRSDDEKLEIN